MVCLAVLAALLSAIGSVQGTAFSVAHANGVSQKGKLRFANVLADDVNGWRERRGHYECRDRGYYMLSFHGLSRLRTPLTLVLKRNGREVLAGYGNGKDYSTASNSGIIYLRRGDILSLHAAEGLPHESKNRLRSYVTLSGFKVGGDGFGPDFRPPVTPLRPQAIPGPGQIAVSVPFSESEFQPLGSELGGPD